MNNRKRKIYPFKNSQNFHKIILRKCKKDFNTSLKDIKNLYSNMIFLMIFLHKLYKE